ncbi:bifunctional diguanylate cyclase/phosphodiesterase [Psychromonas hadalis]|uniref:bifunctional diguanylate cyclase/phosphodiesterase n=1 Tax=Psychromonas hadalis TaxID=211669 RepID=UPI0003B49E58|nr:EAL domain-containing protein [Psychromonas hadalis]
MKNNPLFSFKWYESLQFKMSAIFFLLFLFITFSIFMVLNTFGHKLIEEGAYLRLNEANSKVVSKLEKHTILSATLVDAMANIAEKLPNDINVYKKLILQLVDYKGTETFIAGGGIWPAPYQFNEKIERHSFFWGRNPFGDLEFNDGYNQLQGNGYHNEEWYVPTTHLLEGELYWSKSYTDPYSLQPMVTVSAPLIKDKKNIGVATIDLKLEGLQQLLKKVTHAFGGYAFAIDRNGRFLSYPDNQQVISTITNRDGSELKSFITYQELAKKQPLFNQFADILTAQRQQQLQNLNTTSQYSENLSATLALDSYQIDPKDAKMIVASMLSSRKDRHNNIFKTNNLLLENDALLNETVFVSISTMPDTYWRIITVMPYSKGIEKISATYNQLMLSTLIAIVLTLFILWLFIRYIVTSPISRLAKQVQSQVDDNCHLINDGNTQLFSTEAKGEISALVQIFNQRTQQLLHSHKEIEKLAHFDALTGLPNRLLLINRLNDKLASCNRQQCYGALLFIDLDNFKWINDSLGHDTGDQLLLRVAERFTKCVRSEDTVARLGGDEFVVLIVKNHTYSRQLNNESTIVARKLIDCMQAPIKLKGHQHYVTISLGITVFSNQNRNSDELLRQADSAMYRAKEKGKNGFCFFNSKMQEQADRRLEIEEALRIALDNDELFLVYQPQVDSQGICFGAEALVRWLHPEKGLLSPVEFISIAEQCNLIIPLGKWVLDQACAQLQAWSDEGIELQKISVNVSPKQFRHINFVNTVRDALSKYQVDANKLTLEITEGIVIEDIKDTINKMTILKSLGVSIALDDFGTGYSSLKYLKELPLNQLKIDQSFVRDINNDAKDAMIVETIIAMATHLGLEVIAEGVETSKQVALLFDKGCDQFQGYYFSRPKTAQDFSTYLVAQLTSTQANIHPIIAQQKYPLLIK